MAKIEIFICINETQTSFLLIPRSDIERLAVSPLQWIRYVMFAICGTRGELSTTPNGPAVDYEITEIGDQNKYYYRPFGACVFIDHEGLNERKTTTDGTVRLWNLRQDVIRRDGACVVTGTEASSCDAAHLIPHSKGDGYIKEVIRLRSPEDGQIPCINMTENGILLSKDLHCRLSHLDVALIKTPNHELRPEHIKRFRQSNEQKDDYITLQWIRPARRDYNPAVEAFQAMQNAGIGTYITPLIAHSSLQNVDLLFQGEGFPLPSTVILDYAYGIAAYNAWRSERGDGFIQMEAYRVDHYGHIPPPSPAPPDDPDYKPTSERRSRLEETMDELNTFLMYINGITPEMAAKKREREEQAAQEAGRSKVLAWRNHLDIY